MERPLKIAIPIHCLDPGGVERVALSLATQWRDAGHDVTIILGRTGGAGLCSAPPLDYWRIPTHWSTTSWETPWMVHSLFSYLLRERTDVLFCAGNTYAVVGAAMKLLLGRHAPALVLKISNALTRPDMPHLLRTGYAGWLRVQGRLFDGLVALSEPMGTEVRQRMACQPERTRTIPNPVLTRARLLDLKRTKRGSSSPWATRYLAAGRLVPQKNYPLMLRAFARAARPADTLTIAGEGPERARLETLVRELRIADRVQFAGHVAGIEGLLAGSDCLILSSDYEGLPAVVVEALAAGVPVLATDCCVSMSCLVEHGRTGLLVQAGCEDAFVQGLEQIRSLETEPARARGIAALYEVERASRRYLEFMTEIVAGREHDRRRELALSALASTPADSLR